MDLSAAFDTVHHELLLRKLRDRVGIQGPALCLLQSYLEGRQQRVHMRGKTSPPLPLASGVPQGSVLGPLLFSISVCDLKENFADVDIVQYADDCTLVIPVKPGEDATLITSQHVQRFVDYCAANRIAAEPDKTQLLHIKAKRPQNDMTFDRIRSRLVGRWYARSADFEVPNITVGADLIARYDDGTEHAISANPQGMCELLGFT
eukprot:gene18073-biopygen2504